MKRFLKATQDKIKNLSTVFSNLLQTPRPSLDEKNTQDEFSLALKMLVDAYGSAKREGQSIVYQSGSEKFEKETKEIARLFRLAADKGNRRAQYNLGVCYENGIGVGKDAKEAVHLYRLAAAQRHKRAQFTLGFYYEEGIEMEKDAKEAARWYRLAADQGDRHAQFKLGFYYGEGIGMEKDAKEAARWYRLAANQGDRRAQ